MVLIGWCYMNFFMSLQTLKWFQVERDRREQLAWELKERSSSSCFEKQQLSLLSQTQKNPCSSLFTQRNWSQNMFSLSECSMLVVNKTSLLHEFAWTSFLWFSLTSWGQMGKFYFPSLQGVGFSWGGWWTNKKRPISKEKKCFNCPPINFFLIVITIYICTYT